MRLSILKLFLFNIFFENFLVCTFENIDVLRYALVYTFPRFFTQRAWRWRRLKIRGLIFAALPKILTRPLRRAG